MIASDFAALTARLTSKATALAEAHAQRGDPKRWRKARLLWPLFTKDS